MLSDKILISFMKLNQEGLSWQVVSRDKQKLWLCDFQSANRLLLIRSLGELARVIRRQKELYFRSTYKTQVSKKRSLNAVSQHYAIGI